MIKGRQPAIRLRGCFPRYAGFAVIILGVIPLVSGIAVMIVRGTPRAALAVIRILVLVVTAVLLTLIGTAGLGARVIIMIRRVFRPGLARAQDPLLRAVPRRGLFPPTRRCLLLRGIVWPCVLARP